MIGVLSLFLLFVALIDRSLGEVKANYPQQVHQYSKSLGLLYSQYIQRCWETACQQAPYPPPIILKFCPHPRARLGQFQSQELATSAWALGEVPGSLFEHHESHPGRGPADSAIGTWNRPKDGDNLGPHTKAWLRCMIAYHDYHQILTHIYLHIYLIAELRPPRNFTFL